MGRPGYRLLAAALLLAFAAPFARAADKCVGKVVLGRQTATFKSCAVAVYDDQGVTMVFTEAPLSAEELSTFQLNSYPPESDAGGKKRAILSGGGKQTPSPSAVKSVEISEKDGLSPMGLQDVLALPAQKANLKIEKLSGDLKAGSRQRL